MTALRLNDTEGVARLSAKQIGAKAHEVLSFYHLSGLASSPQAVPIEQIVDQASQEFEFDLCVEELGQTDTGNKILGAYRFKPPAILLDPIVIHTSRHAFTLAHEFGHLVLHRKLRIRQPDYVITDTERDLITGKRVLRSPGDWVEWQANWFAACLLMPRVSMGKALIAAQQALGIKRNLGFIYLDYQHTNRRDAHSIFKQLAERFHVSATNIRYRLSDLGRLIEGGDNDSSHISSLLKEERPLETVDNHPIAKAKPPAV